MIEQKRTCKVCGEEKDINDFYLCRSTSPKRRRTCNTCESDKKVTRELMILHDRMPWRVWACYKCDYLNSKVRSKCRGCKEHTRDESIKKEDMHEKIAERYFKVRWT